MLVNRFDFDGLDFQQSDFNDGRGSGPVRRFDLQLFAELAPAEP